jgi:NAD-dependent dihydropyrimidine dehydrogenase PreA subunit
MAGEVSQFSNWTLSYFRVTGSTVDGHHSAVLVGGSGAVGGFTDDPEDEGETESETEAYGAPGVVFRPRPPEEVDTPDGPRTLAAEAMAARVGEKLVPMAWRDLRFNRVYSNPRAGSVALVGYGGGFLAFDDTTEDSGDQRATVCVLYCPREFSGGVHSKAHAIILDPVENTVAILHGDGMALVMDEDNGITCRADRTTYWNLQPGKFTCVADSINLRGNVALGANTLAAVPLLAGAASQPTPSVWFSPV